MAGEAHSFTAAGNMRAPARRKTVKWILAAWDGLDKTMINNHCTGWIRGRTHSLLQENQPCHLERLKVLQQAMSNSRDKDPSDGITESDVKNAAPDSLIIDASDTEVIDIE